jgi:hypothetical protein
METNVEVNELMAGTGPTLKAPSFGDVSQGHIPEK